MSKKYFQIDKADTHLSQIKELAQEQIFLTLETKSKEGIVSCRNYLDNKLATDPGLFYGINTGFGYLQNVRIDKDQLSALQDNLLKSHACGMGEEVPAEIVKLMLYLKIKSLAYGHSGVQLETVERLMDMYNNNVLPVIYTQGSLGASGDLAPLSHLCLPLIGLGEVVHENKKHRAHAVFDKFGWKPIGLKSKEGLALINGTQFMTAYGMHILIMAERLLKWAEIIAAISFDAFECVTDPLDENIHNIRPHVGQSKVASTLRTLLKGSHLSAKSKSQVQDPYSFRCIPQVHGASWDTFDYVSKIFICEINSVTDNPNIFPEKDLIVSGGNFHGQPLALGLDFLAISLAELGSISERRTYQLISGQRDLPPFLIKDPGLHSGLMIPQYTAAGIVSENKQLSTPSSVDSIPSSNNQEDHVSMGANAATKCKRLTDNVEKILAIELLTAAQAMEFRRPHTSSPVLENIITQFRKKVSFNEADRILHEDMMKAVEFIRVDPNSY